MRIRVVEGDPKECDRKKEVRERYSRINDKGWAQEDEEEEMGRLP